MTYYYLHTDRLGSQMIVKVVTDAEPVWIPCDSANTDYQAYLAWVQAGNTPEPWNPAPSADL